jgi:hypothetical protein
MAIESLWTVSVGDFTVSSYNFEELVLSRHRGKVKFQHGTETFVGRDPHVSILL